MREVPDSLASRSALRSIFLPRLQLKLGQHPVPVSAVYAEGHLPAPSRTRGLVCKRLDIKSCASVGRASSPSGHRMSSAKQNGAERWPQATHLSIVPPPTWESRTTDNLSKELFRGIPEERHTAHQELVENDPHSPPVHWLAIALAQDDLGCDVLWGSTHLGAGGQPVPWPQKGPQGRAVPPTRPWAPEVLAGHSTLGDPHALHTPVCPGTPGHPSQCGLHISWW